MARTKLPMPESFTFKTEMPVRITDINYGNHVGNDAMLGLLQEARLRFLTPFGFSESNIGGRLGLIMADINVIFKYQAKYGDRLCIEVLAVEPETFGFDFYYRVSNAETGTEIAQAKSSMICFDYIRNKPARMPDPFKVIFDA